MLEMAKQASVKLDPEPGTIWQVIRSGAEPLVFLVTERFLDEEAAPFAFVRAVPLTDRFERSGHRDAVVTVEGGPQKYLGHCWLEGPILLEHLAESIGRASDECMDAVYEARSAPPTESDEASLKGFRNELYNEVDPVFLACWRQLETPTGLWLLGGRHSKLVRLSLATVTAAAACLALVFLWMDGQGPRQGAKLCLIALQEPNRSATPFPEEQLTFPHESFVKLDAQAVDSEYRYVLFFDDAGTVEILDEAAMKEADWHWNLTGSRMDTAILIVTAKPLHDTESIENRVATSVRDTSLEPGLRIAWHPAGPQVEVVKMMGTQPRAEVPAWADKVDSVLRTIPGATYHGWSLPVRGPER